MRLATFLASAAALFVVVTLPAVADAVLALLWLVLALVAVAAVLPERRGRA